MTVSGFSRALRRVPSLTRAAAEDELAHLVLFGDVVSEPPAWFAERQHQFAAAYLVVGDLVLPLAARDPDGEVFAATTCIARGGISEAARFRRRERRRPRVA